MTKDERRKTKDERLKGDECKKKTSPCKATSFRLRGFLILFFFWRSYILLPL